MRKMFKLAIVTTLSLAFCFAASPLIDNERARIWDTPVDRPEFDFVTIYVTGGALKSGVNRKPGDVVFAKKGGGGEPLAAVDPPRTIVIEIKNHPLPPIKNTSGLPQAFPRPGVKKILENDLFTIWDYTWLPGKPTPMHFHDKDAIVTYLETGSIRSTTPDGKSVVSDYSPGMVKYNARDRIHTEELAGGHARAIIVELK